MQVEEKGARSSRWSAWGSSQHAPRTRRRRRSWGRSRARSPRSRPSFPRGSTRTATSLAVGAVDPHYTISATTDLTLTPIPAKAYVVTPNPSWPANTATGQWVSAFASTGGNSNVTYTYTTTFTVAALTSTASLSGTWTCDNYCVAYLNGVQFATAGSATTNAFSQTWTFAAPRPQRPWLSSSPAPTRLSFVVTNTAGGNPNPRASPCSR